MCIRDRSKRSKRALQEGYAPVETSDSVPPSVGDGVPKFWTIGEVIKHLRVTAGLSRAELASRTELTQATIQSIERGKRPPHRSTIQKLQRASAMTQLLALCSAAGLPLPSLE